MGVYKIDISDLAKQDIRDIASYISHELLEPIIAEKAVDAIIDAIFTLDSMPERIKFVDDERLAKKEIRALYVNNYTVFFQIKETQNIVTIVRVLYSHRDWSALL